METSGAVAAVLAGKFAELRPHLDERGWRLYLGSEARAYAAGEGCGLAAAVAVVAGAAGVSRAMVMAGAGELAEGAEPASGRVRRPGAGRKKAEAVDPGLRPALRGLLEAATRGDPVIEVMWSSLSLREIEREMAARGHRCKKDALARMMREDGYSLQGMSRVLEGKQHPDRDAQFRHINDMIAAFRAAGDPVVSVDGKKKEQLGPYHRAGRSWRPQGDPVKVRDHDFPDEELGKITPYGVYDIAANRGFVSVGTSRDTAAFAVNALRLWWQQEGSLRYPGAKRLLVTCDAGGSNSYTSRLWKHELAVLAEQAGLEIWVCHFPPSTSKWNKIEHRLFCHITRTWRARPLMTKQDAVAGIAATTTYQGLKVTAVLDENDYPTGREVSDERMEYLQDRVLDRHGEHGEWNYAVLPVPRPAPEPEPEPEPAGPDPALLEGLAVLAGVPAPQDLLAQLSLHWHAGREYRLTLRRGHERRTRRKKTAYRKLSPQAILVAAACRIRLRMTWTLLSQVLGVHHSSISVPASHAIPILCQHGITADPDPPRITTPGQLREHAAAAGITLTLPGQAAEPAEPAEPEHQTPTTHPRTPT